MEYFRSEWEKMGQSFDGIYTGFVASEQQIDQIFHFIETFDTPDTFLLVDPVMGDDGHTYAMFTPELLRKMKRQKKWQACCKALLRATHQTKLRIYDDKA